MLKNLRTSVLCSTSDGDEQCRGDKFSRIVEIFRETKSKNEETLPSQTTEKF